MDSTSDSSGTLFVKEDELVYQKGPSSGKSGGFRTQVFRHSSSSLRVVVCNTPQPLFSLGIYVPTAPSNDKGLPHTLEHLVFCGSARFPHRGYLDALANCNFSQGTNAWTYEDCTCYTLSAASEEALGNVLPVYLDHVLSPLLRDDQFITEVYHYDENGKENGVVFSEMVSSENEENELSEFHLVRMLFPPRSIYGCSYGGLTPEIAKLSNQEIIEYHRQFYDANNLTVVLAGPFSDGFVNDVLQKIPANIIQSKGRDSRAQTDCSPPPASQPQSKHVPFPAADADMGSVKFGWRGPPSEDVETLTALNILLAYLAEEVSSPLSQRFVERTSPLASYVHYDAKPSIPSTLFLLFGGVPYPNGEDDDGSIASGEDDSGSEYETGSEDEDTGAEEAEDPDIPHLFEEDYFKGLLMKELQRIHDTRFDGDEQVLEKAAQQFGQKLALRIEDQPDETIQEFLCWDIVASHFSPGHDGKFAIGSRANIFDTIAELAFKPIAFWLELLKNWLIDGTAYHVVMVPDPELALQLENERKGIERANAANIEDKEAHRKLIEQAVEANKVDLPEELKRAIPLADPSKTAQLPHTMELVTPPTPLGPVSLVQVVQSETDFPDIRLHLPMGALPEELRPYVLLFHGLMLSTDFVLPAGMVYDTDTSPLTAERRIGYAMLDRRLADLTCSREDSVGISMENFAFSWIDELYVMTMRLPELNFDTTVRWMLQAFVFAEFTAERIISVAQHLLSDLYKSKREGEVVLSAVVTRLSSKEQQPGKPRWIETHIGLVEQERVLTQIISEAKKGSHAAISKKLEEIKNVLIQGAGGFLSLGIPAGKECQNYVDCFSREWSACVSGYLDRLEHPTPLQPLLATGGPFPMPRESRLPKLDAPLQVHIPMKALQASYTSICLECDLCMAPSSPQNFEKELSTLPALDYYALRMLVELLHRVDGPLFNAVRGKGYAYGAHFTINPWSHQLAFVCNRASDAPRAILEMRKLVEDLEENWADYVSDFEIGMTRSTIVYQSTAAQATSENIMSTSINSGIYGFGSARRQNLWRNVHLSAITQEHLRRVYKAHLRRFLDPKHPVIAVILTPTDTELLPELGVFERKALEDIDKFKLY
ncbi:hypothetical protein H4R20_000351 [Coemansia guatemalensis]|uniref:Zinc metalloprotease n=1 Tax=Coemansia guatemalensis TaxID=2761395 RepID=A0A9W8I7V5_9FUNG|nr:hypothetical protein H4R20_000351 [Coemansia guatemalensis]